MGHLLAPLAVQPDDLQHFPDVFLRHPPEGLDDPQVFLPGEMAVVTGTFDEASHLPENRETVGAVHLLSQHLDVSRRGANQPQNHFQSGGLSSPVGTEEPIDTALWHIQVQMGHPQGVPVLLA